MAELPFNSDAHNRIAVPSEEPSSLLASRHLKWGSLTNLDGHSWCHAETSEPCEEETGSEARSFQTGMLKYNIYTISFLGKYLFLLGSSSFYTYDKQVLWESAGAFFSARQLSRFRPQVA